MTVLDAFALIAFLAGEPAAQTVETALRDSDGGCVISAVNLAEVIDRLTRVGLHSPEAVSANLEVLKGSGLTVASVDEPTGELAGTLRARYYKRKDAAVSLADCVALALCVRTRAKLATADPALADVARKENVTILALSDSQGRTP